MGGLDIFFIVVFGSALLLIDICIICSFILTRRYKRFYRDTDEGRQLYELLHTKDGLIIEKSYIEKTMAELVDVIDELSYCTDDFAKIELQHHRIMYDNALTELNRIRSGIYSIDKDIEEIVSKLPVKYKDALRYDYNIAK